MAEWLIAAVLKTVDRKIRGFESLSLRLNRWYFSGRCRSGRSGPPAKWLSGLKLDPGFESLPPRLNIMRMARQGPVYP
jgi:hypothetical protein